MKKKQEVYSFLRRTKIKRKQQSERTLPIPAAVASAIGLFGTRTVLVFHMIMAI